MAKRTDPPVRGPKRKTLPGGHKNRRVPPTEGPRLRQALKQVGAKHQRTISREPATGEDQRDPNTGKLKKGHHQGRPRGSTNKIPAGIRGSVKAILERVVKEKGTTVEQAIVDGLSSGPRHADRYLRLAAEYVDGKPTDNVNLNARFNQDELGTAREMLGKKLTGMLAIILAKDSES